MKLKIKLFLTVFIAFLLVQCIHNSNNELKEDVSIKKPSVFYYQISDDHGIIIYEKRSYTRVKDWQYELTKSYAVNSKKTIQEKTTYRITDSLIYLNFNKKEQKFLSLDSIHPCIQYQNKLSVKVQNCLKKRSNKASNSDCILFNESWEVMDGANIDFCYDNSFRLLNAKSRYSSWQIERIDKSLIPKEILNYLK
ncbi:MAG: hypothetical protein IT220_04005 [Flavobacteriaceae bacterium]|nr:hypothetical protein [Flavobacteriaceae bacterium]